MKEQSLDNIFVVDSGDLRRSVAGTSTVRLIPVTQASGIPGVEQSTVPTSLGAISITLNNSRNLPALMPDRYFRISLEEVSEEDFRVLAAEVKQRQEAQAAQGRHTNRATATGNQTGNSEQQNNG